jgi:hypothetical protein
MATPSDAGGGGGAMAMADAGSGSGGMGVTGTGGTGMPSGSGGSAMPAVMNKTPPIVASKEANALRGAGIDPLALPAFVDADRKAHVAVMQSFTRTLGIGCEGCHAPNLAMPTPNKNLAKHMWNDLLGKVVMKDGSPLYCDSCHQGKAKFLDRSDKPSLMAWMQANLVDKLARRDGAPHDCTTCHGSPPVYELVPRWRAN